MKYVDTHKTVLCMLFLLSLVVAGCQLFDSGAMPAEEYTKADRLFYSVLTSSKVDFEGMIESREDLNQTQKDAVLVAFDSWEYMIRKAEAALMKVGE